MMSSLGEFMEALIMNKKPAHVYLSNGVKLNGIIIGWSVEPLPYLILELNEHRQAIMLNNVTTIMPDKNAQAT